MGPIVQVNSPSGSQGHLTPFDQNYKGGLQYVQFDDNSYVAVWEEVQDRSNLGIGYQRFDSEGNPLPPQLIKGFSTGTPYTGSTSYNPNAPTNFTIEKGQGLNDFTVNLKSTGETLNVNATSINQSATTGAEVENLQIIPIDAGTRGEISMVAVWAEKNDLNTYDIRYQKFDNQGNKHGEELLVVSNNSDSVLTNLSTNEFTLSIIWVLSYR